MPKRPILAEDLLRINVVGDPQFSPDGSRLVFPVRSVGDKRKSVGRLWCLEGGQVRQLTFGAVIDGPVKWRPDGDGFAFASNRAKPLSQLHYLSMSGGEPRQLTRFPEGTISKFEWSPDGTKIAALFRERSDERTAEAKKRREDEGESDPPWVITSLTWRLDGDGVFGQDRFRLVVIDAATGEWWIVCEGAADGEYSFTWLADSRRLAVAYNQSKRPTMESWHDDLFLCDADSGECKLLAATPSGNKSSLSLSPDGALIALHFQDRSTDRFGIKNNQICTVAVETGEWRNWTADTDLDFAVHAIGDTREPIEPRLVWESDDAILTSLSRLGRTEIARVTAGGGVVDLATGASELQLGSVAGDRVAVASCRAGALPEIEVFRRGEPEYRSGFNAELEQEIEIIVPKVFKVAAADGTEVHGWHLQPEGNDLPLVVEVHGGPHAMYNDAFFLEMQLLAAQGYCVVFANPRGSTGYGESFARAIVGDWGNRDWIDVRAVTEFGKSLPFVDAKRVAIIGGSYGGYMVNWAISQSSTYRAAVTDRCVSNLLSKSGNSDYTFVPDGVWPGAAYDRFEVLWDRSPVKHFKGVTTATLVIHSEGDLRCHIEQSEQVFAFLQMQDVPSRFVRYPASTSHGMSRNGPPDLRMHRLSEITGWFAEHL